MQHLGTAVLDTPRLRLRPLRTRDVDAIYRNWASDPAVARYLTWQAHTSIDTTRVLVNYWIQRQPDPAFYQWCILLQGTDEPIGMIDVVNFNEKLACATIGYCLGHKHWGQGIMTEALLAVERYLFERVGVERIEAQHHLENPASGRVMQKAGMHYEGIRRHGARDNTGALCDIACYAILREQWPPQTLAKENQR